jgi:O-antigen/teichoic acid export membrane protein
LLVETLVAAMLSAGLLRGAAQQARLAGCAALRLALRRVASIPWRASLTSMAVLLAAFALLNADRWLAARMLTPTAFAQYSFAAIVLSVSQALQALINASVYPLLARRFAEQGPEAVFRICLRASLAVAALGLLFSFPVVLVSRQVIAAWYPGYADAASVLPLLTLLGVLRVSDFFSSYLMITGREGRMLSVNIASLLCAFAIWFAWFRPSGDPMALEPVAWLAALLSLVGSLFAACMAWVTQRRAATQV